VRGGLAMRGVCVRMSVFLVVLLAGCASQVTTQTSHDVYFRAGVPSEFGYAGGETGLMPVIILGNPFPLPKAAVDQSVVAAMQGKVNGPPVRFVAVPALSLPSGYAVVALLNAAPGTSANLLCAQRGLLEPPPPRSERTTVLMAFCGNADARSWAFSTTGPVGSPEDPLFQDLIARTTFALLPRRDDDWGRGNLM